MATRLFSLLLPLSLLVGYPLIAHSQGFWEPLERATPHDLSRLCFLDSLRGWVTGGHGTIMRTTDGGLHWDLQQSNSTSDIVDIFLLDDQRGWALESVRYEDTSTWYGTRLLKTHDGGSTWNFGSPLELGKYYNRIKFLDPLNGWMCGAYGDLLMTTNGGTDWALAPVDSGVRSFWPMVNIRFYSRSYGFVMGGTWDLIGLVWRTIDGGQSWTAQQVSPEPVYDLHFHDSLRIVGIVGDFDYGVSMIRTVDGGEHWSYQFLGILGLPTAMSFRTGREGWAPLGFPGTLLCTTDSGYTWSALPTPRGTPVYDLVFTDSTTGFAVGDSGMILKYFQLPTEVKGPGEPPVSPTPTLVGAYPNPWNSSTQICYNLVEESFVRLTISNMLGQEVARPVEEVQPAGSHRVLVQGEGLASGVYLYTLGAAGRTTTKKFVLLR